MRMALEGVRVVDLTQWVAAPHCTQWLADLGAEVIKIEDPFTGGDPARTSYTMSKLWAGTPQPGLNGIFQHMDRNKKSCAIQLKTAEGKRLVYELIKKADVVATNIRPKAQAKLGIDYETVKQHNPQIVYVYLSGYGKAGPLAERPAFAPNVLARSGFVGALGEPDAPPVFPPPGLADHVAGLIAALGVVTALLVRDRTGIGQRVDTSLLAAATDMSCSDITNALLFGEGRPRRSRKVPANPLYNSYLTKDSRWIILTGFQTDRYWSAICRALGTAELEHDPRFNTHEDRCANTAECTVTLEEAFAKLTLEEWAARAANGDIPWDVVRNFAEVGDDPQFLANGLLTEVAHPHFGRQKLVGIPLQLSETPGAIRSVAPELGQHTEEILIDVLGCDWAEIARLKDQGVIV